MTAPAAKAVVKNTAKQRVANSQAAAKTGQKAAQKAASTKPQTSSGNPPGPAKKSGAQSRVQRTKKSVQSSAQSRVRSTKQSHAKTKSSVAGKYRSDKVHGLAEMRPKTRTLSAEYMAAIVMAIILLFVGSKKKTYHERISRFFIQVTGISGIFFFMSLAGSSSKAAKFVVPFGLLIDLSMLAFLMKEGGATAIQSAVGKGDLTDYGEILNTFLTAEPSDVLPGFAINPPLKDAGNLEEVGSHLGVIVTPGNSPVVGGH